MDKNKRGSILDADHCWEVSSAAERWADWMSRSSAWNATQGCCQDWNPIRMALLVSWLVDMLKVSTTRHLSATSGPWKLSRLLSHLAIYQSPGFGPSSAYQKRKKSMARLLLLYPSEISLWIDFPISFFSQVPSYSAMISALVYSHGSQQTPGRNGAETSHSYGARVTDPPNLRT